MKVILLEQIKGLGDKYDVKEVNGGYARNFLLPKKLVKIATPQALAELAGLKSRLEEERGELKKHLTEIARRISERSLKFPLRVDEKGHPFGSVTKEMIMGGLRDVGFVAKERVGIKLDHPLKEVGDHIVEVDLKLGITTKLKVSIERLQ